MTVPILNRRRVLAGTAAALASPVAALPALAAVSAGPHPDAALFDLCDQVRATVSEIEATPA